jgi:hypothetical protein
MTYPVLHPAVVALPIAPAPWRVNSFENVCDANGFEHVDVNATAINHEIQDMTRHWAEQPHCFRDVTEEENEANNTLIAIAPEMLSWMIEWMDMADWNADPQKVLTFIDRGRDIILRASNHEIEY